MVLLISSRAEEQRSGPQDGSDKRLLEQIHLSGGCESYRRRCGDPNVMPLCHLVLGHETVEQGIFLVRSWGRGAPVPRSGDGNVG
jgi:hypothetical protein